MVTVGQFPDGCFIRFTGDLDMTSVTGLEERLVELGTPNGLYIDLSGLAFIDSSGIGSVVRARAVLAGMGRDLVLVNPSGSVLRVLELLGLTDLIGDVPPEA
jgi:anti-sigma B factor antagonist